MQLGESATMSGFYLSSPIIGSIVWASVWCVGPLMRMHLGPHCLVHQGWHHYRRLRIMKCIGRSWYVSPSPARAMFSFATNNTPCTVVVSVVVLLVCCACMCLRPTDNTPVVQKTGSSTVIVCRSDVDQWDGVESTIRTSNDGRMSFLLIALQLGFCQTSRNLFSQTRNSRFARKEFSDSRHFPEVLCVIIEVQC